MESDETKEQCHDRNHSAHRSAPKLDQHRVCSCDILQSLKRYLEPRGFDLHLLRICQDKKPREQARRIRKNNNSNRRRLLYSNSHENDCDDNDPGAQVGSITTNAKQKKIKATYCEQTATLITAAD